MFVAEATWYQSCFVLLVDLIRFFDLALDAYEFALFVYMTDVPELCPAKQHKLKHYPLDFSPPDTVISSLSLGL